MKKCPNCGDSSISFGTFLFMGIFSTRSCRSCGTQLRFSNKLRWLSVFVFPALGYLTLVIGKRYLDSQIEEGIFFRYTVYLLPFILVLASVLIYYAVLPLSEKTR